MELTTVLPAVAGLLFVTVLLATTYAGGQRWKHGWLFPAALSAAFLVFSAMAVVREGPLGFWDVHVKGLWGNQVWFDLLLAAGVGWSSMWPQARAVGMRPLPWLLLVVLTGSVGLLAVLARLSYLEQQRNARHLSN